MVNPFYLTGIIPEEYFCDREAETRSMISSLLNGENVLLSSARRIGKTQLIRHVFASPEIRDNHYCFYIDIFATSSIQELAYFMGKAIYASIVPGDKRVASAVVSTIKSLAGAFSIDPVTGQPKFSLEFGNIQSPVLTLEEIFTYLEQADRPCIFAIDEFQQIARYQESNVEALLRTHIQKMNNCRFIFAGSERELLEQMFLSYAKPFYNSAQPLFLGKIDKAKYAKFVEKNFAGGALTANEEAIHYCYDILEGNTYCVQKVFHTLFADRKNALAPEDIDDVLGSILEENSHGYQDMMSKLTLPQRQLIIAVAKSGRAEHPTSGAFVRRHGLVSPSSVQKALSALLDKQYLTYQLEGDVKAYKIADKFLERWLVRTY